ncbi:alpha-D-ribose 1-methylphosphonate 5-triphosphate diphosphatase [Prosthecomicrobium pneumaticum]|uniref:Alpha-D-ribose 1-methylphosphonate 5-triphosphate diphosphatase n=1 Tax=Prosthecomicrobium pneumaticum TaxID=81895 RepID=A0A7W9FLM4_9HYPH|nr:alpha-D-ribose 1-methylphosphonate 5-triphosphate diphosphatase [Prosthecomicrobium pneumaticum]MBB5752939.1 alpha-D-ribose 1-methylphosphonate 5-triphosphate diphosphatase [Prosthecomicrobium pneumaticum]
MSAALAQAPSPEATVLAHARLVLADRVIEDGWLAIEDGRIAEIGEGRPPEAGRDLGGDFLIPGLVELHTDHLETHYVPRPKVQWHALGAVLAYDAQIAASGITTVFDSLRVGAESDSAAVGVQVRTLAAAIEVARTAGFLRAEHRTHLRCELPAGDMLAQLAAFRERFPVHMASLMDHTPGERQYRDVEVWKRHSKRRAEFGDHGLDEYLARRRQDHLTHAAPHRRALVAQAREAGIALASHDDATLDQVAESAADGVSIAEFPVTIEAARASHAAGIKVMMGAPNLVRGGSHNGNIAAEALAREGLLDILSSDYVPASLMMAAFELPVRVPSLDLAAAIRTVTATPAEAVGLTDRGTLAPAKRADLVRVHLSAGVPVVRQVWREGRVVA